jgi:hypothetical protein
MSQHTGTVTPADYYLQLEEFKMRLDSDAQIIQLLRAQVTKLAAQLKEEQARRREKHAEAFMFVARTCICDTRVREMAEQHAYAIRAKQTTNAIPETAASVKEAANVKLQACAASPKHFYPHTTSHHQRTADDNSCNGTHRFSDPSAMGVMAAANTNSIHHRFSADSPSSSLVASSQMMRSIHVTGRPPGGLQHCGNAHAGARQRAIAAVGAADFVLRDRDGG